MNASTRVKPSFYDICIQKQFNSEKLQQIATASGVPMSTIEAMCNDTAVMRSDAEKVLAAFSEFTHGKWTLNNNVDVRVFPTFADLYELHKFDAVSLSKQAGIPITTIDQMLCNELVSKDVAVKVLQTLSSLLGQNYTLETVDVNHIDLEKADLKVGELYELIKQHKKGILLDDIAKRYPSRDTVPYAVGQLLADGKVKTEQRGKKVLCIAVHA